MLNGQCKCQLFVYVQNNTILAVPWPIKNLSAISLAVSLLDFACCKDISRGIHTLYAFHFLVFFVHGCVALSWRGIFGFGESFTCKNKPIQGGTIDRTQAFDILDSSADFRGLVSSAFARYFRLRQCECSGSGHDGLAGVAQGRCVDDVVVARSPVLRCQWGGWV